MDQHLENLNRLYISTICSIGYFFGFSGIIGNNGPIDPDGAAKPPSIQLCDQANRPIIFLSNTTGFGWKNMKHVEWLNMVRKWYKL